jgi:DNA polymerase-3 subunit alpha
MTLQKETDTPEDVSIAGIVSVLKEITTKRGDRMAYVTLEDTKGTVEVICFPDLYGRNQHVIQSGKPLMVTGTPERSEDGGARIKGKAVTLLETLTGELLKTVRIRIHCEVIRKEDLRVLKDILVSVRGRSGVLLEFQLNGERQSLPLKNIRIDPGKKDVILKHFKKGMDVEVIDEILP